MLPVARLSGDSLLASSSPDFPFKNLKPPDDVIRVIFSYKAPAELKTSNVTTG